MNIPNKFQDSNLNERTARHGYYQVGNLLFNKKLNAVLEASSTRQSISWNFNHNVYEAQSKRARLNISLPELYRQRALQLREQYDYLILGYSGGADSDTMIKAFLENDIPVDEIWTDYSVDLVKKSGYKLDPHSRDPSNMPAEYFLVTFPELEKIRKSHPKIKIHVSDSLVDGQGEDRNDTIEIASAALSHGGIKRQRYIQNYMNRICSGRTIALVYGIDKMIPVTRGDDYGFVFSDNPVLNKDDRVDTDGSHVEYFYWAPEFPAIVTEQAHRVWDYLHANPEFMKIRMSVQLSSNWMDRERNFDSIIKRICYPSWDFGKIQVNKGLNFNNEHFKWMNNYQSERFFQSSRSFMISILNAVDRSSFFDPRYTDKQELRAFYNFHSLGKLPNINTLNFKE
jgi:hypothetical protein